MNREAEQKAPTAVGSDALLGGRALVLMLSVLLDAKYARGEMCIGGAACLCPRCQLKQRTNLEAASALTLHVAEIKPPHTLGNVAAAAQAMSADSETIQKSTGPQSANSLGGGVPHKLQTLNELGVEHGERVMPPC